MHTPSSANCPIPEVHGQENVTVRLGLKLRSFSRKLISSFYQRWKWSDPGVIHIHDAANDLFKTKECCKMTQESETECSRISFLCKDIEQNTELLKKVRINNVSSEVKVSGNHFKTRSARLIERLRPRPHVAGYFRKRRFFPPYL